MEKYCKLLEEKIKVYLPVWCVSVVFALCVYAQLMCHQLVNAYDGLWEYTYHEAGKWEMSLGRWFWLYIDRLRFGLSSDPWTSILTILCFATGMCLILHLFEWKKSYVTGLVTALFLSSTAVCISLSYRYMSPTFGLAFLFSVFAVWVVLKEKHAIWGIIAGSVSVALMMGLYQAYLGCTCLVIVGYFLWKLSTEENIKETGLRFLKCAVMILTGGILYIILLNIHLKVFQVALSSYNGADTYSILNSIKRLPDMIKTSYVVFQLYFFGDMYKTNMLQGYWIYPLVFGLCGVLLFAGAVWIWKHSRIKAVCYLLLIMMLPIACNAVMLVATDGGISLQMTGALALCLPVLACVIYKTAIPYRFATLGKCVLAVMLAAVLWGNIYQVQIDQNAMYEGKTAVASMTAEIVDELAREECLSPELGYCFIGIPAGNALFYVSEAYEKANSYAMFGMGWTDPGSSKKSWNGICHYICGVDLPVYSTEECGEALEEGDWENMPAYPEKGYVKRIGDVVLIKVNK